MIMYAVSRFKPNQIQNFVTTVLTMLEQTLYNTKLSSPKNCVT